MVPYAEPSGVPTWTWQPGWLGRVAGDKRAAGTTVAVVVPARNEAATIGPIVGCIVDRLVEGCGLVDDLVVVDSGSTDDTADLAARAGARVVDQRAVLVEAGPGRGKGDALWKGLAVTDADLVVFVDADIRNFDERFVAGPVGALLADPRVSFVKAAYDRPLVVGDELHTGGGRVTELMARPLLAAFWPELAAIAQPLSGEYAGRRSLLEQVPIVEGYGVELALLIDIAERVGPQAIGQVDLGRRVHRNQDVAALGRMAFEILHVALDRLKSRGADLGDLAGILPQPVRGADGGLHVDRFAAEVAQRPPVASWRGIGRP